MANMKWRSVAIQPETSRLHPAVWCVNEDGELWMYLPTTNEWILQPGPTEADRKTSILAKQKG